MKNRNKRYPAHFTRKQAAPEQRPPQEPGDPAQRDADVERALQRFAAEVTPAIEEFRAYMVGINRKLEVTPYLDHVEGPQMVIDIARADGRMVVTLIAATSPDGIRPVWDVQSTGRVNTHWVDKVPGGLDGLTGEHVLQKLIALYTTDFS